MSTTRIEGCLWHSLPERDERDTDSAMDGQKFLQLITQRATHSTHSSLLPHVYRRQRYRMVSKSGEGIVCEVSERDGEFHLCIQVPERELFDTLSLVSSWLCARLREAGHAVFLEVEYVKDHPRSVEPGAESSF
ncbi:MAG: Secretion system apparatus protein ssaP [Symbiopectobacterium sp.]|uniref:Secretion system apparatus protein ssaP n=1 Tax=Symbiopectobacterium sp. TaxID=2952789 RepID=UPI0039EB09CA